VAFYGGSFTSLPETTQQELLQPVAALVRSGSVRGIRVSTRPDAVGAATARFLAAHAVTTVELGVQSLEDAVLRAAGRGHDAAVVAPAVAALKAVGCRVGLQLMPGLPGDTPATAIATLHRTLALAPAFLRIYPTVVMAGTSLAHAYRAGAYMPWSLDLTIATVKQMVHAAMRADVPVLRIGLQHSAALEAPGNVLAGPHHPALGELVQAALWRDLLQQLAAGINDGPIVIRCHPQRVSAVAGQRRSNLNSLEITTGAAVRVIGDPLCPQTMVHLISPAGERCGDVLKDVTYDIAA
jgi:histone acetyltransferase (RNA polymerase elongator complex component)